MAEPASTELPDPGASGRKAGPGARLRWAAFALAAALVAVPFLAVTYPPITDLPQQAAQIRLAADALTNPASPYRIQWWTPYSLSYVAIALGWLVGGPVGAGRFGMLLIAVAWVGAAHLLAARRGRPATAAVLASLLVFNGVVYWGFYSFAVGWPAFALWLLATLAPPRRDRPWREGGKFLALAALLYVCHALWLAAGALWLGAWTLASLLRSRGREWRAMVPRIAGMAPVLAVAAVWFVHLRRTNFATPAVYFYNPLTRFSLEWLQGALFGGLRGPFEMVFITLFFAWFLVSLLTNSGRLADAADRPLALAGALFAVVAFALPDQYTNTIQFDERWMPGAMTLLLLAAPPPRWRPRVLAGAAVGCLVVFTLVTTAVWRRFEAEETSGLAEALAALPDSPRVLGLVLEPESRWIDGLPHLQNFAYAQLVHGGILDFSFAEFAPSLVVWREPPEKPWTPHLEWHPNRVRISDFARFDYALVGGSPAAQAPFLADPMLTAVNADGRWRLYRIDAERVREKLRGPPPGGPPVHPPGGDRERASGSGTPGAPPSPPR